MTDQLSNNKTLTNHLGRLLKLAHVDGEFHENEKALILKIGQQNGLPDDELNALIFHTPIYDDVIPNSMDDRVTQLIDYVKLMAADGYVSEEEVDLYYIFAQEIGFKKVILDLLLDCIDVSLQKGLSDSEIREECDLYLAD